MLLAAARRIGDDAERCVALAAIDGLIRANVRPTDKEALALAKLSDLYAPGVAHLLAADAKRYAPALAVLTDRERIQTRLLRAICRQLLRCNAKRPLAGALLRRLMPHVEVDVHDKEVSGRLGGSFGMAFSHGRLTVPGDFPRFGFWTIGPRTRGDEEPTVESIVTRRVVQPGETIGFGGSRSDKGARRVRITTLAALGIERPAVAALFGSEAIVYRDDSTYRRGITSLRADYAARYRKLVLTAREKKLIDDKTASALVPRVTLDIHDLREDKTTPLPSTPLPSTKDKPAPAPAKTVRIGGIDWYTDYDRAHADARTSGKPLWLHFGENPG